MFFLTQLGSIIILHLIVSWAEYISIHTIIASNLIKNTLKYDARSEMFLNPQYWLFCFRLFTIRYQVFYLNLFSIVRVVQTVIARWRSIGSSMNIANVSGPIDSLNHSMLSCSTGSFRLFIQNIFHRDSLHQRGWWWINLMTLKMIQGWNMCNCA